MKTELCALKKTYFLLSQRVIIEVCKSASIICVVKQEREFLYGFENTFVKVSMVNFQVYKKALIFCFLNAFHEAGS